MELNTLKAKVRSGERLYGGWLGMAHSGCAEIMAYAGYDFLILDNEHGAASLETAVSVMRACEAADCPLVVRVPWNDPVYLKRILDAGAISLMVPMVESDDEARKAVAACRYPPMGHRGYAARAQRCTRWGEWLDYLERWNDELLLIAQIESADAAAKAHEIAEIDGIDVVLIGVNDLGGTLGHLEEGLANPAVAAAVAMAENGIQTAGKPMASVPSALFTTQELFERGYQIVAGAVDSMLLASAAKEDVVTARTSIPN